MLNDVCPRLKSSSVVCGRADIQIVKNAGCFLTTWACVTFSRRTLPLSLWISVIGTGVKELSIGLEVLRYTFLTSELDEYEHSASRLGCFTSAKRAPVTHWIREWLVPMFALDPSENSKISSLAETKPWFLDRVSLPLELLLLSQEGRFHWVCEFQSSAPESKNSSWKGRLEDLPHSLASQHNVS